MSAKQPMTVDELRREFAAGRENVVIEQAADLMQQPGVSYLTISLFLGEIGVGDRAGMILFYASRLQAGIPIGRVGLAA